jgi:hypothetical protein
MPRFAFGITSQFHAEYYLTTQYASRIQLVAASGAEQFSAASAHAPAFA